MITYDEGQAVDEFYILFLLLKVDGENEMKYLAHKNEKNEEQDLRDHLEAVAKLCGKFASSFGVYDWGYCCGMLHDIGKYSFAFQERLNGSGKKVDHATAGAQLCQEKKGLYPIAAYCIMGHHSGLPDTGGDSDTGDRATFTGRMRKKLEDYHAYEKEIQIPPLSSPPFQPGKTENQGFFFAMFIRMLYSCLVDADFLDTEWFMSGGNAKRDSGDSIDLLYGKLETYISGWLEHKELNTINGRRTEILRNCLEMGQRERGLFRLTVPTGGGKTVASLAFALRHAKEHDMDRVIYVIPYTSIIEQNAEVFRNILGEKNVLEDHCNVDYEATEELKPMQLATENWDKPVIVTTNVQFFESLFSNKSSKCRKLHSMANSVIIFDEAQMLPNDYMKPCLAAMEQLIRHYRSTVVLCTATQPSLQGILSEDMAGVELCPRMEDQFSFFKRVSLKNLDKISEEELIHRLEKENQALCILNTKKRTQKIYQEMKGEGVYHLSTAMYPLHRKRVLKEIRERLNTSEKCIVIATSLVEAGVELDFKTVYRQLSGVDSIIQAAGRCNREGKNPAEESLTYIFRLNEKEYVPGQRQQMEITAGLLEDGKRLDELETIQQYFEMLYHFRGDGLDKKNIMKEFGKAGFAFAKVGKEFRLIENDTKTILITKEKRAEEIKAELKLKGITKRLIREMGQYCINVYENDFDKMQAAGMLQPLCEEMADEYFVLRNPEDYTEDMGMMLNAEYGQAVLF